MKNKAGSWTALGILVVAGMSILAGGQRFGVAASEAPDQSPESERIRVLVHDEVARQLKDVVAAEVKTQLEQAIQEAQARNRVPMANSMLQTVRSQIALYMLQHNDKAPTLEQLQEHWGALTGRTDAGGKTGDFNRAEFGPYLQQAPVNPFNGSESVATIGQSTPQTGWVYNPADGQLKIVVPPLLRKQFTERDGEVPATSAAADISK